MTPLDHHPARPAVHPIVGPISDPDQNGRLSVLLTPWLGRLQGGTVSVRGFVRSSDFRTDLAAPFSNRADLLYLNSDLPQGTALQTLLLHEVAHAALARHPTTDRSPGNQLDWDDWLNEGLAHLAERRCGGGSRERRPRQATPGELPRDRTEHATRVGGAAQPLHGGAQQSPAAVDRREHHVHHVRRLERKRAFARDQGVPPSEALVRAAEMTDVPKRQQQALIAFGRLLARLREEVGLRDLPELVDEVVNATGYATYLKDGTEEGEERHANASASWFPPTGYSVLLLIIHSHAGLSSAVSSWGLSSFQGGLPTIHWNGCFRAVLNHVSSSLNAFAQKMFRSRSAGSCQLVPVRSGGSM